MLSRVVHYSDVALELVPPTQPERRLPADIATAARATVRGIVLTMLEQAAVHRIRVSWQVSEAELGITVRDDGPGLLTSEALAVHQVGDRVGKLDLDAVPRWGTTVSARIPLAVPNTRPLDSLNPKELDVLDQLTHGRRNRQIAEQLNISEHTVKYHVANIFDKLGVRSRGEAAAVARQLAPSS